MESTSESIFSRSVPTDISTVPSSTFTVMLWIGSENFGIRPDAATLTAMVALLSFGTL